MNVSCLKETSDNWCDSMFVNVRGIFGKFCLVKFHGNIGGPSVWTTCYRVSVSGEDDKGYVFDCSTSKKAMDKYRDVVSLQYVGANELKQLGFEGITKVF